MSMATNRDLPLLLPIGSLNALVLDETAPVQGMKVHKAPTRPRASLVEGDFAWRLLSHLSLNYLSLLDGDRQGTAAASLRELLLLYTDLADPASRRQADSVTKVTSRPIIRRMPVAGPIAFGRGVEIDLTLDESAFGGSGGFILGSVLERLLARHVSINSFTQLRLHSESRGEVARWPARSGSRVIG
jgi:type VI secretion system protein ImpG